MALMPVRSALQPAGLGPDLQVDHHFLPWSAYDQGLGPRTCVGGAGRGVKINLPIGGQFSPATHTWSVWTSL